MMFVALGITNQPTLLAKSMVGYLLSDSASMLSGKVAFSGSKASTMLLRDFSSVLV